jgi:sugar lactone lactonase YvrE
MAIAPAPIGGLHNQLFCVNYFAGRLYRVDPATHTCTLVNSRLTTPHGIAIHQSGNEPLHEAYITELKSGRVMKVDLLTGQETVIADGLLAPARLALLEKNGAVEAIYVTQLHEGSVVRLARDGQQHWQPALVAEGIPLADGIELEPGGTTALVGSFWGPAILPGDITGRLTRIDLQSGAILDTPVENGLSFPAQFTLLNGPDEPLDVYISEMLRGRVARIACDADGSCKRSASFRGIMFPTGISLTPDKSRLFALEAFSGKILGIDTATGTTEIIASLPR